MATYFLNAAGDNSDGLTEEKGFHDVGSAIALLADNDTMTVVAGAPIVADSFGTNDVVINNVSGLTINSIGVAGVATATIDMGSYFEAYMGGDIPREFRINGCPDLTLNGVVFDLDDDSGNGEGNTWIDPASCVNVNMEDCEFTSVFLTIGESSGDTIVNRCLFANNGKLDVNKTGEPTSPTLLVTNCIFSAVVGCEIKAAPYSQIVRNCIFHIDETVSTPPFRISDYIEGTNEVDTDYNCFALGFTGTRVGGGTVDLIGANSFSEDPQFTNPQIGDFSLQTTSPCLGTGDPAYGGSIGDIFEAPVPTEYSLREIGFKRSGSKVGTLYGPISPFRIDADNQAIITGIIDLANILPTSGTYSLKDNDIFKYVFKDATNVGTDYEVEMIISHADQPTDPFTAFYSTTVSFLSDYFENNPDSGAYPDTFSATSKRYLKFSTRVRNLDFTANPNAKVIVTFGFDLGN